MQAQETWSSTKAQWGAAQDALIERFRPLYLAEVERFAESLRPRFESGELRGYTDEDDALEYDQLPMSRLEALCGEHFGIAVEKRERSCGGIYDPFDVDLMTARLILAASPSGGKVDRNNDSRTASGPAMWACAWDVLAIARARGWYEVAPGECPSLDDARWSPEVRA